MCCFTSFLIRRRSPFSLFRNLRLTSTLQRRSGVLNVMGADAAVVQMLSFRQLRSVCMGLFALVGVIHLGRSVLDTTMGRTPTFLDTYKQEIAEMKVVRIRTLRDGQYCMVANALQGTLNEVERISLLLHLSSDRLDLKKMTMHVHNWGGPVSITVVFPANVTTNSTEVQCTLRKLQYWRHSDKQVTEKANVHFLLETETCEDFIEPDYLVNVEAAHALGNCTTEQLALSELEKAVALIRYPVNKARNVARKFASTKYILSADLDHLFSRNFEPRVLSLAKKLLTTENNKTVLVYRIFEVSNAVPNLPDEKSDLHRLFTEYKAQEFHKYYGAHNIPQLYEWFMKPDLRIGCQIQFYKPYTSNAWEPQFVSLTSIPFHDETFKYPLRDNTVLRWEMCRAGYKFAVMDDVFMFHPGFKAPDELNLVNTARGLIRNEFRAILNQFNQRMNNEYPGTRHLCPNFDF